MTLVVGWSDKRWMEWLNYHHLYYFAAIAEEGGLAAAARKLRLTHSTLSAQLRALEAHFGAPLFERKGKRLVLTSFGSDALNYAGDIFRLGRELNDLARGVSASPRDVLRIGVVSGLPKTLTHHLLTPALDGETCTMFVRQDSAPALLEALAAGRLHAVLMNDVPTPPPGARLHSHALGETDILLYGRGRLAQLGKRRFPDGLSDVPFVLPPPGAPLRRRLDAWFVQKNLQISVKAEVEDAGLLRAFGSAGRGIFPVRAALRAEVEDLRDVQLVGACDGLRESYYAVTTERRIRHKGLAAVVEAARSGLNTPAGVTKASVT
ncbi:MAG TPA: LysR family transcriptional regulator [Polyangiaceae bacterium]|nr:LysR family transcriptional regulator [Polyangiaceae bacterium]